MNKLDNFIDQYQAVFGEFPGKGGELGFWKKFLDTVPETRISALIDKADELNGDSRAKPRLSQFKRAFKFLGIDSTKKAKFMLKSSCAICDGSGWIHEVFRTYSYAFPCECELGNSIYTENEEYFNKDVRHKIYEKYRLAVLANRETSEQEIPF